MTAVRRGVRVFCRVRCTPECGGPRVWRNVCKLRGLFRVFTENKEGARLLRPPPLNPPLECTLTHTSRVYRLHSDNRLLSTSYSLLAGWCRPRHCVLPIFPHKACFSRGRRPRPCWISVKNIYWSGDFLERFFLFDPSLTSGMSAALMQGHCLWRRPDIKRHMSGGREFHRKYHRQLLPHLTRHETLHAPGLDYCWSNVADSGPTLSWHFVAKLLNIQYLNHPPYPDRCKITLIQQGLGLRPREQRALLSGRCVLPVNKAN